MQKISVILGWAEAVLVAVSGISFLFAHTWGTQNLAEESHVALGVVSLCFAAGIALATWGLQRGSDLARTPFVLIQVFIGIGAYLGIGSTSLLPKLLGGATILVALVAGGGTILAQRKGGSGPQAQ